MSGNGSTETGGQELGGNKTATGGSRARRQRLWNDPLVLVILALVLALVGNAVVTYVEGRNALAVEKSRLNSNLILEAIRTGDTKVAKQNLSFLITAGLIDDSMGKIRAAIADQATAPVLPGKLGKPGLPYVVPIE